MKKNDFIAVKFIGAVNTLRLIDLDESKKSRALRVLRKAIRDLDDEPNKEIYASECYTVIDGEATTWEINTDLMDKILLKLMETYQIGIRTL